MGWLSSLMTVTLAVGRSEDVLVVSWLSSGAGSDGPCSVAMC